jgi:predicted RNase H-like HicB family nuclease
MDGACIVKYAVIYEMTATGYSAYVPDLPGCVAAASSIEDTESLMRGAIEMHLAGMREDGHSIPPPTTVASYISAA